MGQCWHTIQIKEEGDTLILYNKKINEFVTLFNLPRDFKYSYSTSKAMYNIKVGTEGFLDIYFLITVCTHPWR